MKLLTCITVASLGDHLRLIGFLRRIDLCVEAIMVVLHAIDGLVGLSTLLLRSVLFRLATRSWLLAGRLAVRMARATAAANVKDSLQISETWCVSFQV